MTTKPSLVPILLALLLAPASAFGQAPEEGGSLQEIEVTSQRRVLYPIAVPDVLPPIAGGEAAKAAQTATDALRLDLEISGYFDLISPQSFLHDWKGEGLSPASINFKQWFNVGAQALIRGTAKAAGGKVHLDLRLYKVEPGRQVQLQWKAKEVPEKRVRSEVHAFANEVVRHFTGEPGVFGSRITYVRKLGNGNKAVYAMDHDGHRRHRVSAGDTLNLLPAFSPAGSALVYTSYAKGQPDLYLHRLGNKQPVAISKHPGMNVGGAFSPSGKKLALTLSKDGNSEIYVLDAASGKIQQRLTENWAIDSSPTWSPDGSKIAFVSDRSGTPQIYVMPSSGGAARRLTFQGTYNTTPDWSPKGDRIAFTARDERYKFDIFTVGVGGGEIERLTQDQGNNEEPSWSPDGRYVVFTSTRGGAQRLYVMTSDGAHQTCISPKGGGYSTPDWGPAP